MRIVSLLPSATEIVCAFGLCDELVGISHDCDWPPEIKGKPALSHSVITNELSSAEIDQFVRERLHNGLSLYHLDQSELRRLKPDLILTEELCEVCAPSFDEVQAATRTLDPEPEIISLEPISLAEIIDNIRTVGEATNCEEEAAQLTSQLQARIDQVASRAENLEECPRVVCLDWLEPLFLAGHWVPEMVELAGGETLGDVGEPSAEIDWMTICHYNPDMLILMPCGFHPRRTFRELSLLAEREGWDELRAVKNGQVYIVNGSAYFNRPGPRIVTGLEALARILHPAHFVHVDIPADAWYHIEPQEGD
jgi:iron complex transport system substrate-binding protein